jgi:hypothetical protein
MKDRDHWSDDDDTENEREIEGEVESLYQFGFGEDWEDLPTQDHRTLMRRARSAARRPRKKETRFDILDEYGEAELEELDLAAYLAEARRRGDRPRARRRGGPKNSGEREEPNGEKPARAVLAPRPGPRR